MRTFHKTSVALIGLVVLCGPWALQAQRSDSARADSVHHRNDCRLAAQAVSTGHPEPHEGWAIMTLSTCRDEGGPALGTAWGTLTSTSLDTLSEIIIASEALRDRRILDAVVATARDDGRPTLVRLAAMEVLISYFDPRTAMPFTTIEHPDTNATLWGRLDFFPEDGAVPVTPTDRPGIIATMETIATSTGDARVREAVRYAALKLRQLARLFPTGE